LYPVGITFALHKSKLTSLPFGSISPKFGFIPSRQSSTKESDN
jgi:hypothetical protein